MLWQFWRETEERLVAALQIQSPSRDTLEMAKDAVSLLASVNSCNKGKNRLRKILSWLVFLDCDGWKQTSRACRGPVELFNPGTARAWSHQPSGVWSVVGISGPVGRGRGHKKGDVPGGGDKGSARREPLLMSGSSSTKQCSVICRSDRGCPRH